MSKDDLNSVIFGIFARSFVALFGKKNNISWKEGWLYVLELLILYVDICLEVGNGGSGCRYMCLRSLNHNT